MKRVIKTVLTVAAFGLVAAICAPAQAQTRSTLDDSNSSDIFISIEEFTGDVFGGRDELSFAGHRSSVATGSLLEMVSGAVERFCCGPTESVTSDGSLTVVASGTGPVPEVVDGPENLTDGAVATTPQAAEAVQTSVAPVEAQAPVEPAEAAQTSVEPVPGSSEQSVATAGLVDTVNPTIPQETEQAEQTGTPAPPVETLPSAEGTPAVNAVESIADPAAVADTVADNSMLAP